MRIDQLKDKTAEISLDGYIMRRATSILYFTGFKGGVALLVPVSGDAVLLTRGYDSEMARSKASNCEVRIVARGKKDRKALSTALLGLGVKRMGFDVLDASAYIELSSSFELESKPDIVWDLRKVKDSEEITNIRKAAEVADRGMEAARESIVPGVREYEIAAEIEYAMRRQGSEGFAFETTVASGLRSAFPHGRTTSKRLEKGELVVIDIGSVFNGYRSDLTRAFVVGNPSERQEKLHGIVLKAKRASMVVMRSGTKCAEVDAQARKLIGKKGYGKYFVHNLGHGIGLDIHEPPVIGEYSKDVLVRGNVVTNEPGIYLPGFGGIRVEDTVLITEQKAENLTETKRSLTA